VEIELGFDPQTGLVTTVFQSIDPQNGLPPDVLTGFLPPEDGTGRGQGFFSYTIEPKAGLPTGTEIRNIALITFDVNAQIATNQVDPHDPSLGTDPAKEALNTIDAGKPTSNVGSLPATVESASFLVTWSGLDDAGGSGIAAYDIFVSENGGPFTLWLDDTTNTSVEYSGAEGHTYAFYSIATDNVGHREEIPATPDAQTSVPVTPPTVTAVRVGGSAWDPLFLTAADPQLQLGYPIPTGSNDQLKPLPWVNVDQISLTFSLDVQIENSDLSIYGVATQDYADAIAAGTFMYSSGTRTATWTLPSALTLDKLLLVLGDGAVVNHNQTPLDGEWEDGVDTESGDGIAGGEFQFRLNLLPGDVDQNGFVSGGDIGEVRLARSHIATITPGFNPTRDVNGSGVVNGGDIGDVRIRRSHLLPIGEPVIPPSNAGAAAAVVDIVMKDDKLEENLFDFGKLDWNFLLRDEEDIRPTKRRGRTWIN
jgi:hypothetical protein